jgi:hypothetical protein
VSPLRRNCERSVTEMIEITDEMIKAYHVAWHKAHGQEDGAGRRAGIAAVAPIIGAQVLGEVLNACGENRLQAATIRGIAKRMGIKL